MKNELFVYCGLLEEKSSFFLRSKRERLLRGIIKKVALDQKSFDFVKDKAREFLLCGFKFQNPCGLSEMERTIIFLVSEEIFHDQVFKKSISFRDVLNSNVKIEDLSTDHKFKELVDCGLSFMNAGKVTFR